MQLHFQYKIFIWLFATLVVLAFFFMLILKWKRDVKKKTGDPELIDQMIETYSPKKFMLKFLLIILALGLGIVAVMNPRKAGGAENIKRRGIDIAVALDVSKSMLATDLQPNRLERAKQFIGRLMNALPDDRIALILFAGRAYMQMPLTTDHGAAALFVSSATPDAVPQQGTVISEALEMSSRVFNTAEKKFKTIVLISDGEDHDEDAKRKAADLAERGIMINTVGIGSPEGSTIPDPATGENKRDAMGNVVVSKLNEDILRAIAEKTNGAYIRLNSSEDAVAGIISQLSQIERKSYGDVSLMNFTNYFTWFAAAMFILLVVENFISEKKGKKQLKKA